MNELTVAVRVCGSHVQAQARSNASVERRAGNVAHP